MELLLVDLDHWEGFTYIYCFVDNISSAMKINFGRKSFLIGRAGSAIVHTSCRRALDGGIVLTGKTGRRRWSRMGSLAERSALPKRSPLPTSIPLTRSFGFLDCCRWGKELVEVKLILSNDGKEGEERSESTEGAFSLVCWLFCGIESIETREGNLWRTEESVNERIIEDRVTYAFSGSERWLAVRSSWDFRCWESTPSIVSFGSISYERFQLKSNKAMRANGEPLAELYLSPSV